MSLMAPATCTGVADQSGLNWKLMSGLTSDCSLIYLIQPYRGKVEGSAIYSQ